MVDHKTLCSTDSKTRQKEPSATGVNWRRVNDVHQVRLKGIPMGKVRCPGIYTMEIKHCKLEFHFAFTGLIYRGAPGVP